MILLAAVDLQRAVDLLYQHQTEQLMRESERAEREAQIGGFFHRIGQAQRAADGKDDMAAAGQPLRRDIFGQLRRIETLAFDIHSHMAAAFRQGCGEDRRLLM